MISEEQRQTWQRTTSEVRTATGNYLAGFLSARYRSRASCHAGISIPYFSRLAGDNTEYFGRSAGRTNLSLVVGPTMLSRPARETICCANSNQEHAPRLVTFTIPLASEWQ